MARCSRSTARLFGRGMGCCGRVFSSCKNCCSWTFLSFIRSRGSELPCRRITVRPSPIGSQCIDNLPNFMSAPYRISSMVCRRLDFYLGSRAFHRASRTPIRAESILISHRRPMIRMQRGLSDVINSQNGSFVPHEKSLLAFEPCECHAPEYNCIS